MDPSQTIIPVDQPVHLCASCSSYVISVYLCSSLVAMVFVTERRECYIYLRHAGVNSGIYAMRKLSRWLLLLILFMATTGRTQKSPRAPAAPTPAKLSPDSERWVAQTLKKMTLDEKIGQVFAVWAYGAFMSTESPEYRDLLRDVEEKHIGSFAIQTQGSPLGIERSQVYPTAVLVNTLQSHAKVPLLIAADFERGTSMRIEEGASFPHAMAVGATGRPEDAYTMGKITALEARAVGVPWIFAPDADVNSNPGQSHHQHALLRRRPRARVRIRRRVRARSRRKRRPRHRKAFPRPRRYQHRFASRSPHRNQRPRASGPRRARAFSRGHCRRGEHHHDRPPRRPRARTRSGFAGNDVAEDLDGLASPARWASTAWS